MTDGKWCTKTNCRKGVEERKTQEVGRGKTKRRENFNKWGEKS